MLEYMEACGHLDACVACADLVSDWNFRAVHVGKHLQRMSRESLGDWLLLCIEARELVYANQR